VPLHPDASRVPVPSEATIDPNQLKIRLWPVLKLVGKPMLSLSPRNAVSMNRGVTETVEHERCRPALRIVREHTRASMSQIECAVEPRLEQRQLTSTIQVSRVQRSPRMREAGLLAVDAAGNSGVQQA
jgi:hypothetical protein